MLGRNISAQLEVGTCYFFISVALPRRIAAQHPRQYGLLILLIARESTNRFVNFSLSEYMLSEYYPVR